MCILLLTCMKKQAQHFARYFAYLNLFVFSMLLLVMGANYVIMFIGWEGVGLCSYLLIGYWFKNNDYNNAAKKAFIMNRIGDLGFLLAVFWMISKFGTVRLSQMYFANASANCHTAILTGITLITYLLAQPVKVHRYLYIPGCPMRWLVQHLYLH